MLLEEPSVSVTEVGKLIEKLALASPLTSKVAGLPELLELIVAPPVVVLFPLVSRITVPATELEEISPNNRPFRVLILMVLIISALIVALVVTAIADVQDKTIVLDNKTVISCFFIELLIISAFMSKYFTFIINKIDYILAVWDDFHGISDKVPVY